MGYKLDIYTYPAMTGFPVGMRTTEHKTPEAAIAHLNAQSEPYAYATLQRSVWNGWEPCDWNGKPLYANQEWEARRGTNKKHPLQITVEAEWENLKTTARKRHQADNGQAGLVRHSLNILNERYPGAHIAEKLAWEIVKNG